MQQAIRRGCNIREDLDVSGSAGACVGDDIEVGEKRFSIRPHSHNAASFAAGPCGLWPKGHL